MIKPVRGMGGIQSMNKSKATKGNSYHLEMSSLIVCWRLDSCLLLAAPHINSSPQKVVKMSKPSFMPKIDLCSPFYLFNTASYLSYLTASSSFIGACDWSRNKHLTGIKSSIYNTAVYGFIEHLKS